MPVQIEINESHIDALVDFYIQKIKVLREEIAIREKEAKEINSQIMKLKKGKSSVSMSPSENEEQSAQMISYSDKWPWVRKIKFALEIQGRPLTTKEILDTLIDYEIALMFDRKKAVASISSILSTKSGEDKEFIRVEGETGDFAYTVNDSKEPEDKEPDGSSSTNASPFV
jgi:hypothetical protein